MRSSAISRDRIYTMRELNQHTADVLQEINESGSPAVITRHGRFVAMIIPLANTNIESTVIGKVLDEIEHRGQLLGERTLDRTRSTEEVARELPVSLPDYPDRDR
jgi:prevent-host-death family protein